MNSFLEEKNKIGILDISTKDKNQINKIDYKQFSCEIEESLKLYITNLLDYKCYENNQITSNYALNRKDIINKNDDLKLKLQKIYNVLIHNSMGAYYPNKDEIEIYTTVFYKMLKYYPTHSCELHLVKVMYHEMQHQLQKNKYYNDVFKTEHKLLEDNYHFYLKYHDYFESEIDAEEKSLERLINDIEGGYYPIFEKDVDNVRQLLKVQKNKRKTLEYMNVKNELIKY